MRLLVVARGGPARRLIQAFREMHVGATRFDVLASGVHVLRLVELGREPAGEHLSDFGSRAA